MKVDDIKSLLESFYSGESTPEQEDVLFRYFDSEDIAGELIDEKKFFLELYDASSQEVEIPSGLESDLNSLINTLSAKDKKTESHGLANTKKRFVTLIASVAACLAIIISAGLYFNKQSATQRHSIAQIDGIDTYTDPNVAYEEARKALLLISKNYNKGVGQLSYVQESIDKSNEILNKSINRIK